ncbi:MAG: hypothetical protein IJZ36_01220 [Bacilli bacterium]|nr:hypothetical protein [Bacilli bacterium]
MIDESNKIKKISDLLNVRIKKRNTINTYIPHIIVIILIILVLMLQKITV